MLSTNRHKGASAIHSIYYGPERLVENRKMKEVLCKSAVFTNEQCSPINNDWNSTHIDTYRNYHQNDNCPTGEKIVWNSNLQNESNILFGNSKGVNQSTIQEDFIEKTGQKRESLQPPLLCNLPDMSSKYIDNLKLDNSTYQTHFDGTKTYNEWTNREMSQEIPSHRIRDKSTQYQRGTHFVLGNTNPNNNDSIQTETEASYSLNNNNRLCPTHVNMIQDLTRFPRSARSGNNSPRQRLSTARMRTNANTNSGGAFNPQDTTLSVAIPGNSELNGSLINQSAGLSTVTPKGYSHVLPKLMQIRSTEDHTNSGISALRSYLLAENYQNFQNPRDPTSVNVLSAFSKYDKDRCGYITIDNLKNICNQIGTPISDNELQLLLQECDTLGDGRIDYVEFGKYLLAEHVPQDITGTYESTTQTFFAQPSNDLKKLVNTRPRSGKPTLTSDNNKQTKTHKLDKIDSDKDWSDKFGTNFQIATHFELGNFAEKPISVYQHDIIKTDRNNRDIITTIAEPFPDSKIFTSETDPAYSSMTTARAHATNNNNNNNNNLQDAMRRAETTGNKEKDHQDSVVISARLHSVPQTETTLNFQQPRLTDRSISLAPPDTSLELLSQQPAMTRPDEYTSKFTEVQSTYRSPVNIDTGIVKRQRAETAKTAYRLRDNRQTHFTFGSNEFKNSSEMSTQFSEKQQNNSIPAAGIPSLPSTHFSHVLPRDNPVRQSDQSLNLESKIIRSSAKHTNPRDPINLNLRKAFLEFDKDLTGKVSPKDIITICNKQDININSKTLSDLMKRCDHDNDGLIDYYDFSNFLTSQHNYEHNTNTNKYESTSRKDFKPIHARRVPSTTIEKDELIQKRCAPSAHSHYFHLDYETKPVLSATQEDYKHPLSIMHY